MNIQEITNELQAYQNELQKLIETDDINILVERLAKTASYHARVGYLLADAKKQWREREYDTRRKNFIIKSPLYNVALWCGCRI